MCNWIMCLMCHIIVSFDGHCSSGKDTVGFRISGVPVLRTASRPYCPL